jgi:hypothetical protein
MSIWSDDRKILAGHAAQQRSRFAAPDNVVKISSFEIIKFKIADIRPTEETAPSRVEALTTDIAITGVWTHPLLVEATVCALMDGHHRLAVAKLLGLELVPAILLSYDDPRVHLEAWSPQHSVSPELIKQRALSGDLLPYKSTRHFVDVPTPQCRVQLSELAAGSGAGHSVAPATAQPSRLALLAPHYHRLGARIGIRTTAGATCELASPEAQAPHPLLRRLLQNDPAMAALLPAADGRIALGNSADAPFSLTTTGLLRLHPALLGDAAALSAAARWGLEASYLEANGAIAVRHICAVLHHGRALVQQLPARSRDLLLDQLPQAVRAALMARRQAWLTEELVKWQASRFDALRPVVDRFVLGEADTGSAAPEFAEPVERLIAAGGDSRLVVDPASGLNRYGTTPRPRPEAVHFSSSTASSISDYGFAICDMLRRDLLRTWLEDGSGADRLRLRFVAALADELALLFGLDPDEADFCMTPSGTDAEVVAVMIALAATDRAITNILISPEETGRGVALAGAGRYFDEIAATAAPITKGAAIWPQRDIATVAIPIREPHGAPRPAADVDRDLRLAVEAAVAQQRHPLVHMLYSSKTGLSGPSVAAIEAVQRHVAVPVDIVVDACQLRVPFQRIGEWVRRGWMVQVSGSKFLTGPPFSGALLVPARHRARRAAVARLLASAPGAGHPQDWSGGWSKPATADMPAAPAAPRQVSCGPLFRWVPAVMEAQLFNLLPAALRRYAFDRFRSAIQLRLSNSTNLEPLDVPEAAEISNDSADPDLTRQSIVCFSVLADEWDASKRRLGEQECQRIFQLLNLDLTGKFGPLSPVEQMLAAQKAHIGQPVRLGSANGAEGSTVLRLVLGARFFTIVGHAGPGAIEAALESEISDAIHAIDKVELIARHWWKIRDDA